MKAFSAVLLGTAVQAANLESIGYGLGPRRGLGLRGHGLRGHGRGLRGPGPLLGHGPALATIGVPRTRIDTIAETRINRVPTTVIDQVADTVV